MKKLISMTDFVLEQKLMLNIQGYEKKFISNVSNYANFLKQPLELEMFVPVDEEGNVFEEPIETVGGVELYSEKYQNAKEKVLFEGCVYDDEMEVVRSDNGTDLFYIPESSIYTIETLMERELQLTESAIKQL